MTSTEIISNYLPSQYDSTDEKWVSHNYLTEQFDDRDVILAKVAEVVKRGDFTLGRAVDEFEEEFSSKVGASYAIGVGSGTDAIFLSLKALGIGPGDEVITTAFTFYATIGAIVTAGAKPVFVDVREDYNIDPKSIEAAITDRTKAIVPVHWSGKPCDMDEIWPITEKFNLSIVEDACHAITATYKGRPAGTYGISGCFSMHPLKNLNVWGDGGVVVTNDSDFANRIRLIRNHGLRDRDHCEVFAYNSRLDTVQAVVASHLLEKIDHITEMRIRNSKYLDSQLLAIEGVTVPERHPDIKQVFHIYSLRFERRDELQSYLERKGVDAKVHYPIPMHLQPAASEYGYSKGDFPVAEAVCDSVLSLPVHEFVTREQMDLMVENIKEFYK